MYRKWYKIQLCVITSGMQNDIGYALQVGDIFSYIE